MVYCINSTVEYATNPSAGTSSPSCQTVSRPIDLWEFSAVRRRLLQPANTTGFALKHKAVNSAIAYFSNAVKKSRQVQKKLTRDFPALSLMASDSMATFQWLRKKPINYYHRFCFNGRFIYYSVQTD